MKTLTRLFLLYLLLVTCVLAEPKLVIPESSLQAVVVINSDWNDPYAQMYRFERASADKPWVTVGRAIPVSLGRTGLAWGRSPLFEEVPASEKGPRKREGDGKAPAGLFPLLSAFGHPTAPAGYSTANLPFQIVDKHQCVDDGNSPYYNQIVVPSEVGGRTWNSAETMKIEVYKMGLVVGHNCAKAQKGLGSCIFFHLRSGPKDTTAGCTAMDKAPLTELLLWLKKQSEPVVIQLPKQQFQQLSDPSLPKITE